MTADLPLADVCGSEARGETSGAPAAAARSPAAADVAPPERAFRRVRRGAAHGVRRARPEDRLGTSMPPPNGHVDPEARLRAPRSTGRWVGLAPDDSPTSRRARRPGGQLSFGAADGKGHVSQEAECEVPNRHFETCCSRAGRCGRAGWLRERRSCPSGRRERTPVRASPGSARGSPGRSSECLARAPRRCDVGGLDFVRDAVTGWELRPLRRWRWGAAVRPPHRRPSEGHSRYAPTSKSVSTIS